MSRRMHRIWLGALLLTALVLGLMPTPARAEIDSGVCGDCEWEISDEGVLTIHPGELDDTNMDQDEHFPWFYEKDQVTSVVFAKEGGNKVIAPRDSSYLFDSFYNVETIDASGLDTSNTVYMSYCFRDCGSIRSLDLSGWNTKNVVYMDAMFDSCVSLASLDLSGWNTSNVIFWEAMFYNCSSLETIYVTDGWDTGNANEYTDSMFFDCTNLRGGAGTTYDEYQYGGIDFAHVDGGRTNPGYLTYNEDYVDPILASDRWGSCDWEITRDGVLTVYPGTGAGTGGNCPWADYATSITSVVFAKRGTNKVKAPADCSGLLLNLSNVTSIDASGLETSSVTDMSYMFRGCTKLTSLNTTGWNTSNVTSMSYMLWACSSLTSLDVTGWNTENVKNMHGTFQECSGLTSLDLSAWDTTKVTDMGCMFLVCSSLQTILASDPWSTASVTSSDGMFSGCVELVGGAGTRYDGSNINASYAHIDGQGGSGYLTYKAAPVIPLHTGTWGSCMWEILPGGALIVHPGEGVDTENTSPWVDYVNDITSVTFAREGDNVVVGPDRCFSLFDGFTNLTTVDASGLDTSNVHHMEYMFYWCESLTTIYVEDLWSMDDVWYTDYMFEGCYNLRGGKGTEYSSDYTDGLYARIDDGADNPGYLTLKGADPITYTITFEDWDGTALSSKEYAEGTKAEAIAVPDDPTRQATDEFTYAFAGWEPDLADVTADATYRATYTATKRSYAITWVDGDGNEIKTDQVAYGTVPSYTGDDPTKTATAQFSYTFAGWDPEPVEVTGNATYVAQFNETVNKYTVTFVDEDGQTVLKPATEYPYGTAATEISQPPTPTKDATAQYTYEFAGWYPELATVTANATYKATYTETVTSATIVTQPSDVTVPAGVTFTMSVVASGEVESYSWEHSTDEGTTWGAVAWDGHDTATLSRTMLASLDGRMLRCVVTFVDGSSVTSEAATITLGEPSGSITTQPVDTSVLPGDTFTVSVVVSGVVESYSWEHSTDEGATWGAVAWSGHDTDTLSRTMLEALDGRMLRCVITFDDGSSVTSLPATVSLPEPSGTITTQPSDVSVAPGATFTVSVVAEGEVASYSWEHSTDGGATWGAVAWDGHDTAALSRTMLASFDGRMLRCVVTFSDGSFVTSDPATLTIGEPSGSIVTQPSDASAAPGATFTMSVVAEGEVASYSWEHSADEGSTWGTVAWDGHDTATLSRVMLESLDGRMLRCVVTFTDGSSVTSEAATVTLGEPFGEIVAQPSDATAAAGETFAFTVSATGDVASYSWEHSADGGATWGPVAWAGHDTDTLGRTMLASLDGRMFRCVVTFADGSSVTSDAATLRLEAVAV